MGLGGRYNLYKDMRVLVTTRLLPEGFVELKKNFEVVFPENELFSKEEIINLLPNFDALLPTFQFKIDKDVIDAGVNRLKIIANYGVGFNNIDVEYATQKGIVVTNTPDPVIEPTAEHTFALMLAAARRIAECDRKMRTPNGLKWGVLENLGQSLSGKTLGIIGLGNIGQAVAKRASAFGMKIVYNNRKKLSEEFENRFQAQYLELNDLLKTSDVISLHTPLTDSTFHLINKERLSLLKPTAILVNTSRGQVIDELALIEILNNKMIFAAALDVFENEPTINPVLLEMDNVIIAPHNGTATVDARIKMSEFASRNIIRFFQNRNDITRVN